MKKRAPQLKLPGKCDPQTRWLLAYFLVTLLVQWGWQELFQQFAERTIPYSQFKAHLERREVIDVAVKQDEIAGRIVPLAARQMNAAPTAPVLKAPDTNAAAVPIGLRRALAETAPFFFRTVRVDATFPLLVRYLKAQDIDPEYPRALVVAVFFRERCLLHRRPAFRERVVRDGRSEPAGAAFPHPLLAGAL